jgi:hypothetical protein
MNLGRICRIAIFSTTILILLFDLFLAAFGQAGSTISLQLFHMVGGSTVNFQQKSLLLCVGYLVGHIFGRIDNRP